MTTKLADTVAYLCAAYPADKKNDLSNARLTKLVYLADWARARQAGHQLTDIRWIFNRFGPWVPDVIDSVVHDDRFETQNVVNAYGLPKRQVALRPAATQASGAFGDSLSDAERVTLDSVIADTQSMYFGEFIDYVYETFPVRHGRRLKMLDLERFAAQQAEAVGTAAEPVDFRGAGLDAVTYATMRDRIGQESARRWLKSRTDELSPPWNGIELVTETMSESFVASLVLDPEMRVEKVEARGWITRSSGWVELRGQSALGAWPEQRPDDDIVGYSFALIDPHSSEFDQLVSVRMRCEVVMSVQGRTPNAWIVEPVSATIIMTADGSQGLP